MVLGFGLIKGKLFEQLDIPETGPLEQRLDLGLAVGAGRGRALMQLFHHHLTANDFLIQVFRVFTLTLGIKALECESPEFCAIGFPNRGGLPFRFERFAGLPQGHDRGDQHPARQQVIFQAVHGLGHRFGRDDQLE